MESSKWNSLVKGHPSPTEELTSSFFKNRGIRFLLKRDDKIPGVLNGNKFRKLRLNLINARSERYGRLATCGGAYSNHLLAVSKAGNEFGFETFGFVRGEEPAKRSPVLMECEGNGMNISWVSRGQYRMKDNLEIPMEWMANVCSDAYWIPEGGTNQLAVNSCKEIVGEITEDFDFICMPCGTGGTFAGCLSGLKNRGYGIGIPVLKGGEYLTFEIKKWLGRVGVENRFWHLDSRFHFGGFAKTNRELEAFVENFYSLSSGAYKPDLTYNAKALFGVLQLIQEMAIPSGSTVIYVVTESR